MNGLSKSSPALESFDGNWVISTTDSGQAHYSDSKTDVHNGKRVLGKAQHHQLTEGFAGRVVSKRSPDDLRKIDGRRVRSDYTMRRLHSKNHQNRTAERTRTSKNSSHSSGYNSSSNNPSKHVPRVVVLFRSDGEFGFTMQQIPSSMYGGRPESAFTPTLRVPALQRLNLIDPGSLADRAGLRPGDYVIEINDECVTCSPHRYVVHLIMNSANALKLKVVAGLENPQPALHHFGSIHRRHRVRYTNNSLTRNGMDALGSGNHDSRIRVLKSETWTQHSVPNRESKSSGYSSPIGSSVRTAKHRPQSPISNQSTVANIRLSRVEDQDRVFYEPLQRKRPNDSRSVSSELLHRRPSRHKLSSISSTGSLKSQITTVSEMHLRRRSGEERRPNHPSVTTVPEEQNTDVLQDEAYRNGINVDDINHTYEKIRPPDVPFDTDEGYIRLGANVDYVAQAGEEPDTVDFLKMAEQVRQMYLRKKSASHPPQ